MVYPIPPSLSLPVALPTVNQLSPAAWAYLGDAVYELYVRSYCLFPPSRLHLYHKRVVTYVRAETQAKVAQALLPNLSPHELAVVKQGRNAASPGPKRLDPAIYGQATGLEALVGYLYLTDPERLENLLNQINFDQVLQDQTGRTENP